MTNLNLSGKEITVLHGEHTVIETFLNRGIPIDDIPGEPFHFKLTGRFGISGTGSIHGLSCENGIVDFLVIKVESSNFSDICGRIR